MSIRSCQNYKKLLLCHRVFIEIGRTLFTSLVVPKKRIYFFDDNVLVPTTHTGCRYKDVEKNVGS